MTADQYREALRRLGLTQGAAARLMGVSPVTGRRWAREDGPPRAVAMVCVLMIDHRLRPATVLRMMERYGLMTEEEVERCQSSA